MGDLKNHEPGVDRYSTFGISPYLAYARCVKTIVLYSLASIVLSIFAGCASGKKDSGVRMYEGDTSPNIRMFDEKPGYPLNLR